MLGIIYGVLLGMLIYNLFIYTGVRDTSYLYYILSYRLVRLARLSVVASRWSTSGEQPVVGECGGALPDRLGDSAACSRAVSTAHRAAQPLAQPSCWRSRPVEVGDGTGVVDQLRPALRLATALALATVTIFVAAIKAWYCGRMARYFIINLVGFPARRGGQH